MISLRNENAAEQPRYDGLSVRFLEVNPQGVLCSSAAQTDGTTTITGTWMAPATDL